MSHKLTSKQTRAIYMLAAGATASEIANALMIRRETLLRWRKKEPFADKLSVVMREMEQGLHNRLTALMDTSITALKKELGSSYGDPKRVQTALNVLKLFEADRPSAPGESH
jgi:hypothetical protein